MEFSFLIFSFFIFFYFRSWYKKIHFHLHFDLGIKHKLNTVQNAFLQKLFLILFIQKTSFHKQQQLQKIPMKSCMMMIVLGVMLFVCGGVDAQRQVKVAAAQQEPLSHGHQLGLASYHARPSGFRLADAPAPSPAPILYPTIAEFSVAGCFGSPVRVVQFRSGVNLGVPVFTDAYLAPHFPDRCMSSRDVGYLFTVNATVAVEAHDQVLLA
jgi:hypothetical protein